MKKIFLTDWILIFVFVLSAVSGFCMHAAGHGNDHELWHNRAVFHVLTSAVFLMAATLHAAAHRGWYEGIARHGMGRKSRVTAALTLLFLLAAVTGIIMLGVSGANSRTGLWHYRIGIATAAIAVGHIAKRLPALRKSSGRSRRQGHV